MQEVINNLLNVLPFEFLNYTFMKNAFLAVLLATPIFAILGTMIVNNKMAFFSDSLGHSAICGIAIGTVFGIIDMPINSTPVNTSSVIEELGIGESSIMTVIVTDIS